MIVRSASQAQRLGLKKLRTDDWVVISAIPWYTLLVVSLNKIIFGGGSNYMTPEEIATLTPESKHNREVGSKWVFLSEEVMVLTVWTCKVCMLLLYKRLMYDYLSVPSSPSQSGQEIETDIKGFRQGLLQERIINCVFVYVAIGFVACQIALFTTCRPFSGYWTVPAPNGEYSIFECGLISELIKDCGLDQCWSYFDFEVVEGTFNVSADLAVLIVALPLLMKLSIPIQQKFILLGVFGMGVFVIVAALLTKIFSLVPSLTSYAYLNWYFREASVSLYVTNLPALWALLRDMCPAVKSWGYSSRAYSDAPGNRKAASSHIGQNHNSSSDLEMLDGERENDFLEDMLQTQSHEPINTPNISEIR